MNTSSLKCIPALFEYTSVHQTQLESSIEEYIPTQMSVTPIANTIRSFIAQFININEEDTVFRYVRVDEASKNTSKLLKAQRYKCASMASSRKSPSKPVQLALMGEEGVGKSSLHGRICMGDSYDAFLEDEYDTDTAAMAVDTTPKIKVNGETVVFDIDNVPFYDEWDDEDNQILEDKNIFVLCFSLRSKESFVSIFNILRNIMRVRGATKDQTWAELGISIIFCGTKADDEFCFEDETRDIDIATIMNVVSLFQFPYVETSAMNNVNVQYLFDVCFHELFAQNTAAISETFEALEQVESFFKTYI
jgi:GTPase SAR1 family protein